MMISADAPFFKMQHDYGDEYKGPYEMWKELEGIPTIRDYYVRDLLAAPVTKWKSRGGAGVFINLEGAQGFNDSYVYELEPREQSNPVRHIYEETVYILKGQGATTIWNEGGPKQTFE